MAELKGTGYAILEGFAILIGIQMKLLEKSGLPESYERMSLNASIARVTSALPWKETLKVSGG